MDHRQKLIFIKRNIIKYQTFSQQYKHETEYCIKISISVQP